MQLRDLTPGLRQTIQAEGSEGSDGATGNPGTPGNTGATGKTGAAGAAGSTGAQGAAGTDGSDGATGATGTAGTAGTAGAAGAVGSAWGEPTDPFTPIVGYPGTIVSTTSITLGGGATGAVLSGIAQPSRSVTTTGGTVACYFAVDGIALTDDSEGQIYFPASTPINSPLQLTTIGRITAGSFSDGSHSLTLRCYTGATGLENSVAYISVIYTSDVAP